MPQAKRHKLLLLFTVILIIMFIVVIFNYSSCMHVHCGPHSYRGHQYPHLPESSVGIITHQSNISKVGKH